MFSQLKISLPLAVFFIIAGIVLWGGFNTAMEATNKLGFCISCHEMESTVYREYQKSAHYHNATGVQAVCADCHVPREWTRKLVRKISASRELFYWMTGAIDSPEKFEAKRLELAQRVWHSMEASDSRECRNCHSFDAMAVEKQARFASRFHSGAEEAEETCIDCHKGIAHRMPATLSLAPESASELSRDDLEYGEEINDTCAGCHGEFAQGSLDGEYPRLAGLDAGYLARQIEQFKSRDRLNIPMLPYATERELPGEDIRIISNYLASIKLPTSLPPVDEDDFNAYQRLKSSERVLNIPRYPGSVKKGAQLYQRECSGCHGSDGYGKSSASAPQLAGQFSAYMKRQIALFREGERLHDDPRDAQIFAQFTENEINDILAFLSVADDNIPESTAHAVR